jgi:hypothetical protein
VVMLAGVIVLLGSAWLEAAPRAATPAGATTPTAAPRTAAPSP